jgi:uncharacterized protein DUF929
MNKPRLLIAGTAVVIAAALVVAIIANRQTSNDGAATVTPADAAAVVAQITSVPQTLLEQVGQGSATTLPTPVNGTPIAVDGKPEILYVGAEYCPYCAAERWPLTIALSRFGTFANVGVTHSSSTDVYANTPTLTFHGSTYTSDVVAFTPVEVATNQPDGNGGYKPLDTPTADQSAIVNELSPGGGIPFIDFGGKFLISGATYDPGVLSDHTATQIAADILDPASDVSQAVLGTANAITAVICEMTSNAPSAVCSAPAIAAIAAQLSLQPG